MLDTILGGFIYIRILITLVIIPLIEHLYVSRTVPNAPNTSFLFNHATSLQLILPLVYYFYVEDKETEAQRS